MISRFKRYSAEYDYYEYIISKKQEIERRKLPKSQRTRQERRDKEYLKKYMEKIPRRKLLEIGENSREYFIKEYNTGHIHGEELDDILADLDRLDDRLRKNIKLQAKKGTAEKASQKGTKKSKLNIRRTATTIAVAAMIATAGGIAIHNHIQEERAQQQQQQEEIDRQIDLQNAQEVLEDKTYSVYDMAESAMKKEDGMYLIDKLKEIFIDQYEEKTGNSVASVSLIRQDIVVGRNRETGEVVHADRNLPRYIAEGFDISTESRYLIFDGDAIGADGKYIQENFLGECLDDGTLFTDSNENDHTASVILSDMAKTSGVKYVSYDGSEAYSESLLEESFEFEKSYRYRGNKISLGNRIAGFYSSASVYYEEQGINLKREYGNRYALDAKDDIITYLYEPETEADKEKVREALKTIDEIEKETSIEQAGIQQEDGGYEWEI